MLSNPLTKRKFIKGIAAQALITPIGPGGISLVGPSILGGAGKTATPYNGHVATGCFIPSNNNSFGATNQMEAFSMHVANVNITTMSVAVSTWYISHGTNVETAMGGVLSTQLRIEYPIDTPLAFFTWSGVGAAGPASLPNNSNNYSDFMTGLNIPAGAVFGLHIFATSTTSFVNIDSGSIGDGNQQNFARDAGNGEKFRSAASGLTMQATGSAIVSSDGNQGHLGWRPVDIIGLTSAPSGSSVGDSRMEGFKDSYDDGTFAVGYARTVAPYFGFVNLGAFGLSTAQFLASNTHQMEIHSHSSFIWFELGTNDINSTAGGVLSTFLANQQSIFALFPGKQIFVSTLPNVSNSTDLFTTTTNQTAQAGNANFVTYNDLIRAGSIAGVSGYFEFANVVSTTQDSGIWKVTPPISAVYSGSVSGQVLTVTAMISGTINPGTGLPGKAGDWIAETGSTLFGQISGTAGGVGTYHHYASTTLAATTIHSNAPTPDGVHEYSQTLKEYIAAGAFNHALVHYP